MADVPLEQKIEEPQVEEEKIEEVEPKIEVQNEEIKSEPSVKPISDEEVLFLADDEKDIVPLVNEEPKAEEPKEEVAEPEDKPAEPEVKLPQSRGAIVIGAFLIAACIATLIISIIISDRLLDWLSWLYIALPMVSLLVPLVVAIALASKKTIKRRYGVGAILSAIAILVSVAHLIVAAIINFALVG